jgi:hypothetical protein
MLPDDAANRVIRKLALPTATIDPPKMTTTSLGEGGKIFSIYAIPKIVR